MDKERIIKGNYAAREERKKARKLRKRNSVVQQDAFQKNEGIQYQPQGFHSNSNGS